MTRNGIVISGGGSKGAFAVGAITWMLQNLLDDSGDPLNFQFIAGTSTGSLISPAVALQTMGVPGIMQGLKNFYTTTSTRSVLQVKDVVSILQGDSLFGTDPLKTLIQQFYVPAHFNALQASASINVVITVVNMATGNTEYFYTGPQLNPANGIIANQLATYDQFVAAMLASASEPIMMPLVTIPGYTGQYTDGGVNAIMPLEIVEATTVDALYGISLSTAKRQLWYADNPLIPDVLMRFIDVVLDQVVQSNIDTFNAKYPGKLRVLVRPEFDIEQRVMLKALSFDPAKMTQSFNYGFTSAQTQCAALPT